MSGHRSVHRLPSALSFAEAASPTVFLTAWHALADEAELRAGQRVLIHSAASAVGLAAVQIARHLGAEVFATAPHDDRDALRGLGLDEAHLAEPEAGDVARKVPTGLDLVLAPHNSASAEASAALLLAAGAGSSPPADPIPYGSRCTPDSS